MFLFEKALLTALAVATAPPAEGFRFFEPVRPPRAVQVMAHRGLHGLAPENTAAALEACVADFVEWAEVDVRLSKDGRHVLCHDARLGRVTDGKGDVAEKTLAELQRLDAGAWFAPRFRGARLLSLEEALKLAKGRLNLYLDCKRIDPEGLAREVLAAGMQSQVVCYADPATLEKLRAASGGRLALMTKYRKRFPLDAWAEKVRPHAVEVDADEVSAEMVQAFRARRIKVQVKVLGAKWDNPEVWSRVLAAGADWVQTDFPLALRTAEVRRRIPRWPVRVAWHRGANRYAPENTVPAIRTAAACGADYVEIDIRTSKDGRHFLLHDRGLARTTNGRGNLNEQTAEALGKLDAGAWFGRPFVGTPVPTLDAALEALGERAHVYLDAKAIEPAELLRAIRKHGLMERSVVYQGEEYLARLKKLDPGVRLLPPLKRAEDLERVAKLKPYGVDASWRILSKELIDRCHGLGIRVFSDALGPHETVEEYQKAMRWGIDVIQTDHPARVLRAIELYAADEPRTQ